MTSIQERKFPEFRSVTEFVLVLPSMYIRVHVRTYIEGKTETNSAKTISKKNQFKKNFFDFLIRTSCRLDQANKKSLSHTLNKFILKNVTLNYHRVTHSWFANDVIKIEKFKLLKSFTKSFRF